MKKGIITLYCLFQLAGLNAQLSKDVFYASLFGKDSLVDYVLKHRNEFRLQFIVTDIQRDENGKEEFINYDFTTGEYFYPASMVKLPTAIVMMEIMDSLNVPMNSFLKMNSDVPCGNNSFADLSRKKNIPISLAMEDMLSISNNQYYSMFFHAVSPEVLNRKLLTTGILNTKIYSSFSGCYRGKNVETNSYKFFLPDGTLKFSKAKIVLDSSKYMGRLPYTSQKLIGKYVFDNGAKIEKPFDFNYHLDFPLIDIHGTLFRLVFPSHFIDSERFKLSLDSRKFLLKCMANFPSEMSNKAYHNPTAFPNNYFKYAIIGDNAKLGESGKCRTFSKIGISYGFVTESAYIVDFESKKDFLFSVSMYVNQDGVVNDGAYEYNKIARPFIASFTRIIQSVLPKPIVEGEINTNEYFKFLNELIE